LSHASKLASLLAPDRADLRVLIRARWYGLRGRRLVSLDANRMMFGDHVSRQDEYTTETTVDIARIADIHVSHCQEKKQFSLRAQGRSALKPTYSEPAARNVCLSAVVPAFAEPDIHLLSRAPQGRHRRLSLCSLPVPKQLEGSLRSLISFAQSANSRTWQPARCVIP